VPWTHCRNFANVSAIQSAIDWPRCSCNAARHCRATLWRLSLSASANLLQRSNMLAALPAEAVRSWCKAGILTVLVRNLPLGLGTFGLITRRDHKLSPGAQLMLNTLREVAGPLYQIHSSVAARARSSRA
jgi:DNA-binding transcriptional LysR family regulator